MNVKPWAFMALHYNGWSVSDWHWYHSEPGGVQTNFKGGFWHQNLGCPTRP